MIPLDCVCASTRRAARLVTQVYTREMGAAVEPSQFLLLSVLAQKPGCPQVALGEALGYDKTSLSRGLRLMYKNGWITETQAKDGRQRGYRLTPRGTALLAATKPRWKQAQGKMRGAMSPEEWDLIGKAMAILSRAASELTLRNLTV